MGMIKLFESGGKLHWMKNLYQRYSLGAGCCDIFNLNHRLAKKILPSLKRFRAKMGSYPCELTFEQWESYLDEMIWAFEFLLNGEDTYDKEKIERQQRGFELFGKYYKSLWM